MLLRLRMLCLFGGVILFLPLFALPAFLLRVVLVIFGLLILWLSYSTHKHAALLLRTYKELKDQQPTAKKNNYV